MIRHSVRRSLICFSLGLVAALGALCGSACSTAGPPADLRPGSPAPDFTLPAVRGGTYRLSDLRGQVVLLSFLNTQADAGSATPDPSRAQIMFLKSMQEQYGPQGTVAWIVDGSRLATGRTSGEEALLNFTYDWQLDALSLLVDGPDNATARQYGVVQLPTTFLIDASGLVQQRWDGFASASQLALALEALVGPPAYRQTTSTPAPTAPGGGLCARETLPQARFAGLGLARPLSEEMWVVDDGQAWGSGGPFPLRWIVLDRAGKAARDTIHLQVTAYDLGSGERVVLVDAAIEPLPPDQAQGLLAATSGPVPDVYLLANAVTLAKPACLHLEATVAQGGATLYAGQAFVRAN